MIKEESTTRRYYSTKQRPKEKVAIAEIFLRLYGRNADPNGRTLRRDEPFADIHYDLDSPLWKNAIRAQTNSPLDSLFIQSFMKKSIDRRIINAALEINQRYQQGEGINGDLLPLEMQLFDGNNTNQYQQASQLLIAGAATFYSQKGKEIMLELTGGKYKRVKIYRIMKCASSTLFNSIISSFIDQSTIEPCFKPESDPPEWCGYKDAKNLVELSWNPLGYRCKAFNFAQSHFPIHEFNKYPKDTYTTISLREPIKRIASFYNMTRGNWNSIEDFVDNCHPDFIAGQLYFCHQSNKLAKAKAALRRISRVLIVEESSKWSEQISSDLCQHVEITSANKGKYERDKDELTSKTENLISNHKELKSRVDDEYKLYDYAKTLSTQ